MSGKLFKAVIVAVLLALATVSSLPAPAVSPTAVAEECGTTASG